MVTLLKMGYAGADGINDSRTLIAEHNRHWNPRVRTVVGVKAAVAHTACHHLHSDLAKARFIELKL